MHWLSQNWIWIAFAVGGVFLMTRMGGRGMGHHMWHRHDGGRGDQRPGTGGGSAFDPVSHHAIASGDSSVSALYQGRAFYFESRENRDLFESDPEEYLPGAGQAGRANGSEYEHAGGHRRRGC